jgi:hypothetical protein
MWINDVNRVISESLDGYDGFEEEVGKWIIDPNAGDKEAWDKEWKRTNK